MDLRAYIEERSIPIPFAGCWLWLRSIGSHGYGQASCPPDRVTTAHRVAYRAFKGPIPKGLLVQHKCDQRWCVNPDHLELGTDKTNCDDKVRKGRDGRTQKVGKAPANRKLDENQIAQLRAARAPQRELARTFGISQPQVGKILRGESYKKISPETRLKLLKLGAIVAWETKNYGALHAKAGIVIEVVAAGALPSKLTGSRCAVPRRYESYVIESHVLKMKRGRKQRRRLRYWPLASELKLVAEPAENCL